MLLATPANAACLPARRSCQHDSQTLKRRLAVAAATLLPIPAAAALLPTSATLLPITLTHPRLAVAAAALPVAAAAAAALFPITLAHMCGPECRWQACQALQRCRNRRRPTR